jgi:hypothetical protein
MQIEIPNLSKSQKRRAEQEAYRKFQETWQREQREQAKRKFEEQQRLTAAAAGEGSLSLEHRFSKRATGTLSLLADRLHADIDSFLASKHTCKPIGRFQQGEAQSIRSGSVYSYAGAKGVGYYVYSRSCGSTPRLILARHLCGRIIGKQVIASCLILLLKEP